MKRTPLKRRTRLRSVGSRATREREALQEGRYAAMKRAGGCCERCGTRGRLHVHHIVSRARAPGWSGLHKPDNLSALCFRCHREVHDDPAGNPRWIRSAP